MDWIAHTAGMLNAEEWQALAAMGTLLVALAAAVFAGYQVREASLARREQSRPYVVAFLDRVAPTIVDLVVKNFGTTAARDVRLAWSRPPTIRWGKEIKPFELFERLPVLVPGQEWRSIWDSNGRRLEDDEEPYLVTLSSKDSRGRQLPDEHFDLDTRHYKHEMRLERKGLHEVAESLKTIERTTTSWTDGIHGLSVYSRDGDAKDQRDRQGYEERVAARNDLAQQNAAETTANAKKRTRRKQK